MGAVMPSSGTWLRMALGLVVLQCTVLNASNQSPAGQQANVENREDCDKHASSIMKAYATQDCIDFAAGAGDQTKISLHASAWCKAGKPCRSKLRNPVDLFALLGA